MNKEGFRVIQGGNEVEREITEEEQIQQLHKEITDDYELLTTTALHPVLSCIPDELIAKKFREYCKKLAKLERLSGLVHNMVWRVPDEPGRCHY